MQVDSQAPPSLPGAAAGRPGSPPGKAPRKTPSRPAKVAHQAGKLGSAHLWADPGPFIALGTHQARMPSHVLFLMWLPEPLVGHQACKPSTGQWLFLDSQGVQQAGRSILACPVCGYIHSPQEGWTGGDFLTRV